MALFSNFRALCISYDELENDTTKELINDEVKNELEEYDFISNDDETDDMKFYEDQHSSEIRGLSSN